MTPMSWIELLAYIAAKHGNDFSRFENAQLDELAAQLQSGKRMRSLAAGLPDYAYYLKAYTAVLGGHVGEYEIQLPGANGAEWEKRYGLKAFSPIAGDYAYADGDRYRMDDADVTLYAVWQPIVYQITFQAGKHGQLDGGTADVVYEFLYHDDLVLPTIQPDEFYYFGGWEPSLALKITGNQTYTATWTDYPMHDVHFDANTGQGTMLSQPI